jgi:hypothetical protein
LAVVFFSGRVPEMARNEGSPIRHIAVRILKALALVSEADRRLADRGTRMSATMERAPFRVLTSPSGRPGGMENQRVWRERRLGRTLLGLLAGVLTGEVLGVAQLG